MANKYYKKGLRRGAARLAGQHKYRALLEKNKDKKILVFLHLFYPESWKEIREYLRNFQGYSWDLCITYPDFLDDREGFQEIKEDICRLNPERKGYSEVSETYGNTVFKTIQKIFSFSHAFCVRKISQKSI